MRLPSLSRAPASLPTSPTGIADLLLSLSAARSLPKGQQLHAHLIKSGLLSSPSAALRPLSNHLITFYARCGLPLHSRAAFDDSPSPLPPAAWSSLLAALAQNGLPLPTLAAFRSLLLAGVAPSDRSLPSAAKAAAAISSTSLSSSIHALALKTPFADDVFVASSLVDMYAKSALIADARRLFDLMPNRNVVSWSAMIYGYAECGFDTEALRLFKAALAELQPPGVNDFTYSCVIRVCSTTTLLELGSSIHGHCFKTSFDSSTFVGSSLISLYSKCGIAEHAYKLFDEMPQRNLGAWNAILIASAQHGHTRAAFARFREMKSAGFAPNFITFLCLLTACSHAGLVDDGKRYFASMAEHGIEAGPQHYAAVADLLSRAGRIREAVSFIEAMPIAPTESVWGALITGCRIHKDADTAAYAAGKLFETGSLSSGAHVLLSNAYSAAGRYAEAARARKAMRDRGVRKETGLSWLEAAGKVHTFVSSDRSHPRSDEIYAKLEEVERRMEEAGYVADTREVLQDVGGEEKRAAIRFHSERLAIALGLLLVADGQPIRVMKNLRVCADCHTAIKWLTKCTPGVVVVLRDNHRFHSFHHGDCSCGDYW
ncbi:putative pentatricopeptide repeat-containing protein At5g52630 [Curcuma longa]|uniref:putative pentatricopeptide repeat-containing protein At5g52630 n=1 Tax=Curcuma longa TaxID=136217 RepID=UPI003D9F5091